MTDVLRTPDERFAGLPDFPFEPHYAEIDGLRVHYVEEGPSSGEPVLMLHGEPTWSFLYRKVIPVVAEVGYRVIAPDFVGFGRSDKPARREEYTYGRYIDWLRAFVEKLELERITLVCHDWGGLVGLRVAAEHEERFSRIVALNTFLTTGDLIVPESFLTWREYSQTTPELRIGRIVNGGCVNDLAPEVAAAYDAPFPDESYKAAARQIPLLIPITPDDPASEPNRKAWEVLQRWEKPFLTAFGDSDPISRGGDLFFQAAIPGARGMPHVVFEHTGHYVQEDKGGELAAVIVDFLTRTSP